MTDVRDFILLVLVLVVPALGGVGWWCVERHRKTAVELSALQAMLLDFERTNMDFRQTLRDFTTFTQVTAAAIVRIKANHDAAVGELVELKGQLTQARSDLERLQKDAWMKGEFN